MHSWFDDGQTEQFVKKLNKSLRWTPASVRTELHAELRQHLEALAAAHEELGSSPDEAFDLALLQFGDPTKIGRKLWWEWFRGTRPCVSPGCQAALLALWVYFLCDSLLFLTSLLTPDGHIIPNHLWLAITSSRFAAFLPSSTPQIMVSFVLVAGIPLLAGFTAGRKFPGRAVKGVCWMALAPLAWVSPAFAGGTLLANCAFLTNSTFLTTCVTIAIAALFGGLGAFSGGKNSRSRQKITHQR